MPDYNDQLQTLQQRIDSLENYINTLAATVSEVQPHPLPTMSSFRLLSNANEIDNFRGDDAVADDADHDSEDNPVVFHNLEPHPRNSYGPASLAGGLTIFAFRTNKSSDGSSETTGGFRNHILREGRELLKRREGHRAIYHKTSRFGRIGEGSFDRLCIAMYLPPNLSAFGTFQWNHRQTSGTTGNTGACQWFNSKGHTGVEKSWFDFTFRFNGEVRGVLKIADRDNGGPYGLSFYW